MSAWPISPLHSGQKAISQSPGRRYGVANGLRISGGKRLSRPMLAYSPSSPPPPLTAASVCMRGLGGDFARTFFTNSRNASLWPHTLQTKSLPISASSIRFRRLMSASAVALRDRPKNSGSARTSTSDRHDRLTTNQKVGSSNLSGRTT